MLVFYIMCGFISTLINTKKINIKAVAIHTYGGIARPGPTTACALLSTSQAQPLSDQQESRDSIMNQTRSKCMAMGCLAMVMSLSACSVYVVNLSINTSQLTK